MWTLSKKIALLACVGLIANVAVAHADGIYNISGNSVGDNQGISSAAVSGGGSSLACSYTPVTTGTQNATYTGATPSASGGSPAYTFSETGSLPSGLSINSATGIISGTPSVSGSFPSIQVKVTDAAVTVANCGAAFTLVISPAGTYQGPGDVVAGAATVWGSCARAYSAAYAAGGGNFCDLVDSAAPTTVICTLKSLTTGFVDLASASCTGAVTPAVKCAAATGGQCNISKVYNQVSPGTNDLVQVTAASQPKLQFSALNGLPGMVSLNASGTFVATAGSFTVSQPFSMSVVMERTANFTTNADAISQANTGLGIGSNIAANQVMFEAGSRVTIGTGTDNAPHCVNALFNSAASAATVDGVDATGLNPGAGTFAANPLRLFRSAGASFSGFVMEAGWWSTTSFAAGDRTGLCTNQRSSTSGYNF